MLKQKVLFRTLMLLSLIVGLSYASQPVYGAPCDVAGAIISDTIWSPASCDYYNVTGNVIVYEGVTLAINPARPFTSRQTLILPFEGRYRP